MMDALGVALEALAVKGAIGVVLLIFLVLAPLVVLTVGGYVFGRRVTSRSLASELADLQRLRDKLTEGADTITSLRARIARLEAARSQVGLVLPEGFLAAVGRELCEGNSEHEVALAERYLETHAEALHRAFLTMTRATLNCAAEEGTTKYSTALGYALGALAVRPDDESTRELAEELAAAAALPSPDHETSMASQSMG